MAAELRIGGAERECVLITVLRYQQPELTDFWDANWVATQIEIQAGGWTGRYTASLWTTDFVDFRQQVEALYCGRTQEARFETLEGQLALTLKADSLGHIRVEGAALDEVGVGNKLEFTLLELDLSYLPAILRQVHEIEERFPVRGDPAE